MFVNTEISAFTGIICVIFICSERLTGSGEIGKM